MCQCNSNELNVSCSCRVQFSMMFRNVADICKFMSMVSSLKINIYAYNIITLSCNRILFKIIPSNKGSQSLPDLKAFRCLLCDLDLDYCEDEVLRVDFISSFTGVFAETVCVLSQNVDIYYSYIAEDGCLIFETSSIDKAISVLCS